MMLTMITKNAAANYWRDHSLEETVSWEMEPGSRIELGYRESDIPWEALTRAGVDECRLDILVTDATKKRKSTRYKTITWSGVLPEGSARLAPEGFAVSSPEMCFVQCAATRGLLETIRYGLEICGTYATEKGLHGGTYGRAPLTDTGRLVQYVSKCGERRGVAIARRALQYIVGWSASPMETAVLMLLCLPVIYGGYGLPYPDMNGRFNPAARGRKHAQGSKFYCDLYWPEYALDVEYNGKSHEEDSSKTHDALRNNIIQSKGTMVIVLTWDSVFKVERFDQSVQMIVKRMRIRYRHRIGKAKFVIARNDLRQCVMPTLR